MEKRDKRKEKENKENKEAKGGKVPRHSSADRAPCYAEGSDGRRHHTVSRGWAKLAQLNPSCRLSPRG